MDKTSAREWGRTLIVAAILALVIVFATPFGEFVFEGVRSELMGVRSATDSETIDYLEFNEDYEFEDW